MAKSLLPTQEALISGVTTRSSRQSLSCSKTCCFINAPNTTASPSARPHQQGEGHPTIPTHKINENLWRASAQIANRPTRPYIESIEFEAGAFHFVRRPSNALSMSKPRYFSMERVLTFLTVDHERSSRREICTKRVQTEATSSACSPDRPVPTSF